MNKQTKFYTWFKNNDRKALETLAEQVNCSPDYLALVARGHKKASFKLAKRVESATSGEITKHDLREDIFGPEPTAQ